MILISTILLISIHIPALAFVSRCATPHSIDRYRQKPTISLQKTHRLSYHNNDGRTALTMERGEEKGDGTDDEICTGCVVETTTANATSKRSRRSFVMESSFLSTVLLATAAVEPSRAGEVGAMITKTVTTSDLGVSVRRSVVKGAQVIDSLDGKWEKFSDENNLGKERSKRASRPKPKEIPDPLPLDTTIARAVLTASDDAFLSMVPPGTDLNAQIAKVDGLVRTTFERGGGFTSLPPTLGALGGGVMMDGKEFNYYCYVHYRAFCTILVETKLPFNRKKFERELGERLLPIFLPPQQQQNAPPTTNTDSKTTSPKKEETLLLQLQDGLTLTDKILNGLRSYGFASLAERTELDPERIADWTKDGSELQFDVPIEGDITLNAQILLQEQGYRIYPSFGRVAIAAVLQGSLVGLGQVVSSEEYYMDTNWNSDPDLFEVRQVLVNVVIDSD